jgi:hypothetical protein
VFGIPAASLHMWIGHKGRRIAFNRGNSLYFNLTVFIDLRFRYRTRPPHSSTNVPLQCWLTKKPAQHAI